MSVMASQLRGRRRRSKETAKETLGAPEARASSEASGEGERKDRFEGILTFSVVSDEMDWGLLFLLGSGFVIASVSHACGLAKVMVHHMEFLKRISLPARVACIMGIAALTTQVTSNTATVSIIMPLLSNAVRALPHNPLLLMLPANVRPNNISCDFAQRQQ